MGADRRGPLAAFIVVAIIAAVLLVTSVRSQAAPSWMDPRNLPSTVVAAPVTEPHLWDSVSGGVDQVVQDGVVLVHRAATDADPEDQTRTEAVGLTTSVATHAVTSSTTHLVTSKSAQHAPARPHHQAAPRHPATDDGSSDTPGSGPTVPPSAPPTSYPDPTSAGHDHGRHLGWAKHHGQSDAAGDPAADDPAADDPAADDPATDDASQPASAHGHGHGQANGAANGQANGHGDGQGQGHGHAFGHAKH